MQKYMDALFEMSNDIRYVAVYDQGELTVASRSGTTGASSSESDRYEELLVNPTLLTLVTQRGNIDCGGVKFVLVRYGNFYQLVMPMTNGHISICIEPHANPLQLIEGIQSLLSGNPDY